MWEIFWPASIVSNQSWHKMVTYHGWFSFLMRSPLAQVQQVRAHVCVCVCVCMCVCTCMRVRTRVLGYLVGLAECSGCDPVACIDEWAILTLLWFINNGMCRHVGYRTIHPWMRSRLFMNILTTDELAATHHRGYQRISQWRWTNSYTVVVSTMSTLGNQLWYNITGDPRHR